MPAPARGSSLGGRAMGEAEVGGGGAAGDKGPGEAATSPAEETVVWSPEVEVCLFHAMLGHKPVGEQSAAPGRPTRVGAGRPATVGDARWARGAGPPAPAPRPTVPPPAHPAPTCASHPCFLQQSPTPAHAASFYTLPPPDSAPFLCPATHPG